MTVSTSQWLSVSSSQVSLPLIVGVPTLRLKGDYLAIATLGMAEIIRIIIVNGGELTNGAAGIDRYPSLY